MIIGKNLVYLPSCQSTNTHLASLSQAKDLSEGTAVYTFEQTAGRGQRGNVWESEPKANLTFSYLLFPKYLPLTQLFALSMVTALGTHDFLSLHLPAQRIKVKYPNDVLVGSKKIGGILIENVLKGECVDKAVIGIGLNINQLVFENLNATSLLVENESSNKVVYALETCLHTLLDCLDKRYQMLKEQKYFEIKADFLAQSFQFNELCTYFTQEGEIYGKIIDVDMQGRLYIETKMGIQMFNFKEIAFFPPKT